MIAVITFSLPKAMTQVMRQSFGGVQDTLRYFCIYTTDVMWPYASSECGLSDWIATHLQDSLDPVHTWTVGSPTTHVNGRCEQALGLHGLVFGSESFVGPCTHRCVPF